MKTLITKRNKLVRFADKSPAGRTTVEEYEPDELVDDSEDEKKLRSAERRALVKIREKKRKMLLAAALTLQQLTLKPAKLHQPVCPLKVRFLLTSLFFACSPFVGVNLNRQTSALVADREATGRVLLSIQVVLEDPLQLSQPVKMQTDDSYQTVFQRLGQDDCDLTDLVQCLGDFDPVTLTCNFVESSDSLDSCFIAGADYQDETPIDKVKGNRKLNVAFWEHIGASRFIRDTILDGYKILFFLTPHLQLIFPIIAQPFSIAILLGRPFLISWPQVQWLNAILPLL